MLDNSTLSTTLTAPITSRQISYTPKNTTVAADATAFDNARRYQEFINRLNKDYEKALEIAEKFSSYPPIQSQLMTVYMKNEDYESAIKIAEKFSS